MTLRILAACSFAALIAAPAVADHTTFEQYANGAMLVYSTFKEPSKEESERFYAFIKEKWNVGGCNVSCTSAGVYAGKQYAYTRNVPLESDKL